MLRFNGLGTVRLRFTLGLENCVRAPFICCLFRGVKNLETIDKKATGSRLKVLLVEDEKDIATLIAHGLEREGYGVITAPTGEDALELMKKRKPHLVILDMMLPGIQGQEILRQIRKNAEFAQLPILIVSAKAAEVDRVLGLELGADDYITKPFSMRELVARVAAASRRVKSHGKTEEKKQTFLCRGLFIDFEKYEFRIGGKKIELGPIEMKLLMFFARNPGRVYTRDQLLDQVWGNDIFVTPRTVDVHISRLRKVIEKNPEEPEYIVTVRGVGYKLDDSR